MTSTTTYGELIASSGLSMTCEWAESNPAMVGDDAFSRDASHYLCTISNEAGETMRLHYSMGSAHTDEPTLEMVLDSLASDASGVENEPDWLAWAEEMGMLDEADAESLRQARTTYETIERQAAEMRALLPDEAFETLLWNTERL